jgi:hypothetical protein
MSSSTLPRRARAGIPGWSHPYSTDPWSPVFYADGDADDDQDDDAGDEGDGDQDDDDDGDQDDGDQDGDGDADDDADPEGADQLGDKGKQALDRMKEKLKAERTKRRQAEERLRQSSGSGDDAATKATAAATAAANQRILKAEIRAAAKGKLADPRDALTFLNLEQFEVDDSGQVDEDEITDAIEDLLKNKPYLAAQGGRRFQGTADGGAARKAGRPKQLTEKDLDRMSPEEIDKAASDGRLDDLLKG